MNKSMLVGLVAGIGVATAGGVAGYQFLGQSAPSDEAGSALVEEVSAPAEQTTGSADVVVARAAPTAQPKPQAAPRPAAAAAPAEECWDEEITVEQDPKDEHQIAGTALGAAVGGAIGKDVGDRKLTTAAGAAAGAFIGRKIQQKIQDNRAEKRTVTTVERRCAPAGTPH